MVSHPGEAAGAARQIRRRPARAPAQQGHGSGARARARARARAAEVNALRLPTQMPDTGLAVLYQPRIQVARLSQPGFSNLRVPAMDVAPQLSFQHCTPHDMVMVLGPGMSGRGGVLQQSMTWRLMHLLVQQLVPGCRDRDRDRDRERDRRDRDRPGRNDRERSDRDRRDRDRHRDPSRRDGHR